MVHASHSSYMTMLPIKKIIIKVTSEACIFRQLGTPSGKDCSPSTSAAELSAGSTGPTQRFNKQQVLPAQVAIASSKAIQRKSALRQ